MVNISQRTLQAANFIMLTVFQLQSQQKTTTSAFVSLNKHWKLVLTWHNYFKMANYLGLQRTEGNVYSKSLKFYPNQG